VLLLVFDDDPELPEEPPPPPQADKNSPATINRMEGFIEENRWFLLNLKQESIITTVSRHSYRYINFQSVSDFLLKYF